MIRFQNTGTASAIDVRISDALPIHVNVGSFVFLGSSHPCTTQIAPGGLLEFRFDGINLPDSTSNEPNSHGWVMFRMTPNSYLLPGAVVGNNANIFFDFNAPVLTNTATFEVQLATTMAEGIRSEELRLWPNPARDALNVALDRSLTGACHIALVDAQGRMVRLLQHTPNDRAFTLPLQGLATGLYNVRIKADGLVWNRRFVKDEACAVPSPSVRVDPSDRFGPRVYLQLLVDVADVVLHRTHGDLQFRGDLLVHQAVRQGIQHFPFTQGQELFLHRPGGLPVHGIHHHARDPGLMGDPPAAISRTAPTSTSLSESFTR